jgi:two-component system, OmpR family, KDP operon response regulator KdpE
MTKESILIIDDEAQIRKLLSITLQSNNYSVLEASTGKEGISMVSDQCPDLVLLDLGLPDESGHDVLRHIREWFTNPIIIISVLSDDADIVKALENGANDYLVKPFRMTVLLERIRATLQKATVSNVPFASFVDLTINFASRTVTKNGVAVNLTTPEYSLLSILVRNDGKVLTHQYLLNQIWEGSHQGESQHLKALITKLRTKLEADPNRPQHIITESSIGYRFVGNT